MYPTEENAKDLSSSLKVNAYLSYLFNSKPFFSKLPISRSQNRDKATLN